MKALIGIAGFLLFACGHSPEPVFYALSARDGQTLRAPRRTIQVRRPSMPGYLDRPHIVRRSTDERLDLGADERWAAPLDEMSGATLSDDLAARLPDSIVFSDNGTISATPDVTVEVQISRFERAPSGSVELRAALAIRWTASNGAAQVELPWFRKAPPSATTADLVATMSEVLAQLADQAAKLIAQGPPAPVAPPPNALSTSPSALAPE